VRVRLRRADVDVHECERRLNGSISMTTLMPTPETLAREFADALEAILSPKDMREIVRRNRGETHPRICHTHDFCDANVVLFDVFIKYGMDIAAEGGRQRWGKLWDDSWQAAKAAEFWST
jgi:hypothetical protein